MQLPLPPSVFPRHWVAHDGYQVQYLPQNGADRLESFHFVVKRTYAIQPPLVAPVTMQHPLNMADVYYDGADPDPLRTPLRYETDLMPPKAGCDVILNGHCYAPGGEAVQCIASLQVGDNPPKRVRVIGDRSAWLPRGRTRARLTGARPFSVRPLRWEYAYGGVDTQAQAGLAMHPANPAGIGFWAAPFPGADLPERDHFGPLPNLENPDAPLDVDRLLVELTNWEQGPQPWGFGWVPKQWAPRADQAGIDPKTRGLWDLVQQAPIPGLKDKKLPVREMDPAFLNGAPEGQVIPHPHGGEWVELHNVHPTEERLKFRLPAEVPRLRWSTGTEAPVPVRLKMDTITIEPDVMLVDVIWRGTVPCPDGFSLADFTRPPIIEVDGEETLPAQLLDTGFPIELITEGRP